MSVLYIFYHRKQAAATVAALIYITGKSSEKGTEMIKNIKVYRWITLARYGRISVEINADVLQ